MKNKKVVILWHNGGRLANQLWLYISVLAYCLEKGYELDNYSFFEYAHYFNIKPKNKIVDFLFFKTYCFCKPLNKLFKKIHNKLYDFLFRKYYELFLSLAKIFLKKKIIASDDQKNDEIFYLPPSNNANKKIIEFDNGKETKLYLIGWLFRNPVGIMKHRKQIVDYFRPKDEFAKKASEFVSSIRLKYKNVYGVHVRQGDYISYRGGELYFTAGEIAGFLSGFLKNFNLYKEETCFIICSDGKIDEQKFSDFNIIISKNDYIVDMLILSLTDKIIGSDSTFGAFASYYGDKPFLTLSKPAIDWDYYMGKNNFFENKYLTTVHF